MTRNHDAASAISLSQADFEKFFSLFPDPICVVSPDDGYFKKLNGAWVNILGYSLDELLAKPFTDFIHLDDVNSTLFAITAQHDPSAEYINRYKCKDGSYRHFSWQISAITGNDLVLATARDITELLRSREDMLKTQKLESLGVMAGGIAHDFNNILTAIIGNISLARLRLQGQEEVELCLKNAENASLRAKGLTQQLLTFAKGNAPIKKVVKIDILAMESAGFSIHGSASECIFAFPENLWPVEADEGQLSQVLQNLVINAVQAMPNGGTINLGAENVISQSGAKFVRICVRDNGVGIPVTLLSKIFDPYFTTKPTGNGLGLAASYSIIQQHGGKIRVSSTPGIGSSFVTIQHNFEKSS